MMSLPKDFRPNDENLKLLIPEMLRNQYLTWSEPMKLKKTELKRLKDLGVKVDENIELPVATYRSKGNHNTQIRDSLLPRFFGDFNPKEIAPQVLTKKWIEENGCCYRWIICKHQDQEVVTKPPPKVKPFTVRNKYVTRKRYLSREDFKLYDDLVSSINVLPKLTRISSLVSEPQKRKKKNNQNSNEKKNKKNNTSVPPPPSSPPSPPSRIGEDFRDEKEEILKREKKKRKQKRAEEFVHSPLKRKVPIKISKLHKDAIIPDFATSGSAGADVFSVEDKTVKAGDNVLIDTGLAMEIPEEFFVKIHGRSGLASREKVTTEAGVIDSDYRGKVFVLLRNNSQNKVYHVKKGDKIAQMIIEKKYKPDFIEVDSVELTKTNRKGGFGSTGR